MHLRNIRICSSSMSRLLQMISSKRIEHGWIFLLELAKIWEHLLNTWGQNCHFMLLSRKSTALWNVPCAFFNLEGIWVKQNWPQWDVRAVSIWSSSTISIGLYQQLECNVTNIFVSLVTSIHMCMLHAVYKSGIFYALHLHYSTQNKVHCLYLWLKQFDEAHSILSGL